MSPAIRLSSKASVHTDRYYERRHRKVLTINGN